MKKFALTLITGLLISFSASAQSKLEQKAQKALEKVQASIELTDTEQAKFLEISTARFEDRATWPKGLKQSDNAKFKELAKKNRKKFESDLSDAFGEARAKEIIKAGKNKKVKKGKKGKKNKKN